MTAYYLSTNPTFADEFNSLNLQRQGQANGWATAYSWDKYETASAHTISGEAEVYVDPTFAGGGTSALGLNPFSVSGGMLTISASPTPDWAKGALWNAQYTSGVITTAGSFSQTYGYFEMRADLPEGKGSFPAFWLLDGAYNELDVVEVVNGGDQDWNHVHYHAYPGSAQRTSEGFSSTVPGLTKGFHNYGVLWTPETLTWYLDGVAVASTATPATMHQPMYMLANYAVGGSWAGAPDGSGLSEMKIDYIHAYSLENAPVSNTPAPAAAPAPAPTAAAAPAAPASSTSATALYVSAAGDTHVEGEAGVSYATFTVSRSGDLSGPSTATWSVSGSGSAPADAADFGGSLPSGTVFFGSAESTKEIWVPISGDKTPEANEGFTVSLRSASGAAITGAGASATILNDDGGNVAAAAPAAPSGSVTVHSGSAAVDYFTGTAAAEQFVLSPSGGDVVFGFDSANDTLVIPVNSGLGLSGSVASGAPHMVDVANPWVSIEGAQLVRWLGAVEQMDSIGEVDATLTALPGNNTGGALVLAYTPGHKVGVYYDADPSSLGGTKLLATLDNLVDTRSLAADDFLLFS